MAIRGFASIDENGRTNPDQTNYMTYATITNADSPYSLAVYTLYVDASSGNVEVDLPSATGSAGKVYEIMKTDSSVNTVTIDPGMSHTINGAASKTLSTQYEAVRLRSNGVNWFIF